MLLSLNFAIYMQADLSNIKEQLLKDFVADDICLLGSHLVNETPGKIYQLGSSEVVL